MAQHVLKRDLRIGRPLEEVFDFFSNAKNLEQITPPDLNFHILTPGPIDLSKGALIDYKLGLYGIPVKWRTEITEWDPPNRFVDTQLFGPYSQWIHTHRFTAISINETLIEDDVRYRLPLEPLGDMAHFLVRRQLDHIFDFREKAVSRLLMAKT